MMYQGLIFIIIRHTSRERKRRLIHNENCIISMVVRKLYLEKKFKYNSKVTNFDNHQNPIDI